MGNEIDASIEFVDIAHLKVSITDVKVNAAFHEASEESFNDELARATAERTQIGTLFDSARVDVVEMQEKLAAKDTAIEPVVAASCATLWPSIRSLVESFRVVLNKSVGNDFQIGSLDTQLHADTAIDGVTLHFAEDAASEEDGEFFKGKDLVDPAGSVEIIEL